MDETLAVSQINSALTAESLPVTYSRKGYPRCQASRFDRAALSPPPVTNNGEVGEVALSGGG